jgi:glutathione S-transferase
MQTGNNPMPDPIVYGFPRSTYVNIVRLVLTHKDVAYTFHDLEPVMGKPERTSSRATNSRLSISTAATS